MDQPTTNKQDVVHTDVADQMVDVGANAGADADATSQVCTHEQFSECGYVVIPQLLPHCIVDTLKAECDSLVAYHGKDALLTNGCVVEPLIGGSLEAAHPARALLDAYKRQRALAVSRICEIDKHARSVDSDGLKRRKIAADEKVCDGHDTSAATKLQIERHILRLLDARKPGATICPSEAARATQPNSWRSLMEATRAVACSLVERGVVEITQRGQVMSPTTFRGPIRIRKCHAGTIRTATTDLGCDASSLSPAQRSDAIVEFTFGSKFQQTVRPLLSQCATISSAQSPSEAPESYLFNEHYVVKPPRCAQSGFEWHTDAAEQLSLCFRPHDEIEYVSLWCPLDDVSATNGTLRLMRRGAKVPDADSTLGDAGDVLDIELKAGGAVAFSSLLWHCSTPNRSDKARRVYYSQWSPAPITPKREDKLPLEFAVPAGRR